MLFLEVVPKLPFRRHIFIIRLFRPIFRHHLILLPYLLFRFLFPDGLSLLQHIGKQRGRQMPLVAVPVFRHPHPLPLLWSDAAGLQLLSVDGCHTLDSILPGLEDGNTLNTVQVNLRRIAAEQIHFQVGLDLRQCIILVRQLHPYLVDVVHRLLERGEKTVHILLIGIDAVPLLVFRLDIECPTVLVILNHLHGIEPDLIRPSDSFRHVQRGELFQRVVP